MISSVNFLSNGENLKRAKKTVEKVESFWKKRWIIKLEGNGKFCWKLCKCWKEIQVFVQLSKTKDQKLQVLSFETDLCTWKSLKCVKSTVILIEHCTILISSINRIKLLTSTTKLPSLLEHCLFLNFVYLAVALSKLMQDPLKLELKNLEILIRIREIWWNLEILMQTILLNAFF